MTETDKEEAKRLGRLSCVGMFQAENEHDVPHRLTILEKILEHLETIAVLDYGCVHTPTRLHHQIKAFSQAQSLIELLETHDQSLFTVGPDKLFDRWVALVCKYYKADPDDCRTTLTATFDTKRVQCVMDHFWGI